MVRSAWSGRMGLSFKSRRLLPAAMIAALAVGAATAVFASGAGQPEPMITLKAGPQKLLTIKGSDGADELTIAGSAPGSITIIGNHEIKNQRTDCDVNPGSTVGFCGDDSVRTIEMGMGPGRDSSSSTRASARIHPDWTRSSSEGGPAPTSSPARSSTTPRGRRGWRQASRQRGRRRARRGSGQGRLQGRPGRRPGPPLRVDASARGALPCADRMTHRLDSLALLLLLPPRGE